MTTTYGWDLGDETVQANTPREAASTLVHAELDRRSEINDCFWTVCDLLGDREKFVAKVAKVVTGGLSPESPIEFTITSA